MGGRWWNEHRGCEVHQRRIWHCESRLPQSAELWHRCVGWREGPADQLQDDVGCHGFVGSVERRRVPRNSQLDGGLITDLRQLLSDASCGASLLLSLCSLCTVLWQGREAFWLPDQAGAWARSLLFEKRVF